MSIKPLKFGHKTALIVIEGVMVLCVLVLVAGGALVWRLNMGPLEVGFARKFIESELSQPDQNLALRVDKIFLEWSTIDSRPQITLDDVRLINTQKNQAILAFESAAITLSRSSLLVGNIAPRSIIIARPLLTVSRMQDNTVRLALEQKAAAETPDDNAEKPDLAAQSEEIFKILDRMTQPPHDLPRDWPLRSLRMIRITEARVMVEDYILQRSWLIPKMEFRARRNIPDKSLETRAALWLEDGSEKADPTLTIDLAYKGDSRNVIGDVAVQGLEASFLASKLPDLDWLRDQDVRLDGQAQIDFTPELQIRSLGARLQSPGGTLRIPDFYDRPVTFKSLALDLAYDHAAQRVTLNKSDLVLEDDFSLSAEGTAQPAEAGGYAMGLNLMIHSMPQARVVQYWPNILKGEPVEDWALHRLSQGRLRDAGINFALAAAKNEDQEWSVTLNDIKTQFFIEDMTVDYSAPLMPLREAYGRGVYDYKTDVMVIDVEKGKLGDLAVESGKVTIDVVAGDTIGDAIIEAHIKGPLKTVLDYIGSEPIGVKDIPTDINKVEGLAEFDLNVSFPTLADLPAEKIVVSADGTLNDVLLPGIVSGLDVAGGPMKIKVKDARLDVAGKGRLSGREMDFTFGQYFESKGNPYSAQVVANIGVDKALRDHFQMDLSDWVYGTVPAKVTYTDFGLAAGRSEIDVALDMTPAMLMVKPMNYSKPPGVKASARAKANLVKGNLTEIKDLIVETPDGLAQGGWMNFEQVGKDTVLRKGGFTRARLRESDVALQFDITPQNVINMDIKGSFLDGSPFLENDKKGEPYSGPGLNAKVSVTRMRTTQARLIENVRLAINMDKTGDLRQIEMDALAGRGKVLFRYVPDRARSIMTLRIEAEDAGATLRAFDIYENAVGGTMKVHGESAPGGNWRVVNGKAEMTNFVVANAPTLARLVNALSLPGIMQLLGNEGISFTRLESDFSWAKAKGGDVITVKDGRTSGASIGLTFDGSIDRIAETINITGTIVPVTLVNDIIGSIPVLGEILSGGSKGGVFAATYSMRGAAKNPTITVNPLAVLTPGFLRRIFFE